MPDLDVNAVNNLQNAGAAASQQRNSGLGQSGQVDVSQDTFLRLLTAQLQNQDPLEPQQNSEFVAQLAQFQTLEGQLESNDTLQRLAATQESQLVLSGLSQAASLVGSEVAWHDPYTGAVKSGVVDQITVENGVTSAHVGDYSVPIGLLDSVRRPGFGLPAAKGAATTPAATTAGTAAAPAVSGGAAGSPPIAVGPAARAVGDFAAFDQSVAPGALLQQAGAVLNF